jgi:hypothetical protein
LLANLTHLETIIFRAALALYFTDSATGQAVSDGIWVRAWGFDPANPQITRRADEAEKSPNSGIYGFRTLPGLEGYQIGEEMAAGSLAFIVRIEDRLGRYLPQTQRYDLPLAQPAVQPVALYPTSNQPAPTGYAAIRGQLLRTTAPAGDPPPTVTVEGPAHWAQVTITIPPDGLGNPAVDVTGQADGQGAVVIMIPYPMIAANVLLTEATWIISSAVAYERAAQDPDYQLLGQVLPDLPIREPGQEPDQDEVRRQLLPPFQATLDGQSTATLFSPVTDVSVNDADQIYRVDGSGSSLDFSLMFGRSVTLRAQVTGDPDNPLSELLVQFA